MQNKKGSIMFYALMLGIAIFVLALALAPAIRDFTYSAMNETVNDTVGMNCSTTTDNFIKVTCIVTDLSLFYFVGALILISGAVVTAKFLFEGVSNE
jgi:cellobiose-specific phosphotransferase system component IIC